MSIIDRLLDEAEKAQRKGHLVLAEVCRDAADELGLVIEERNRLREELDEAIERGNDWCDQAQRAREIVAIANSVCGKNNCNCPGAKKVRSAIDGTIPRMPVDRVGGW